MDNAGWVLLTDNKKPINLEPKMAGLMGSTKWGHQRKAVALLMTDARKKSSADVHFFLKKLLKPWPDDDNQRPGES